MDTKVDTKFVFDFYEMRENPILERYVMKDSISVRAV